MAQALIQKAILDLENAEDSQTVILSRGIYEAAEQRWKEIEATYKEAELAAIDRLGGSVDLDENRRLYVGETKRTKCRNVRTTFEAIGDACGWDVDAMAEHLSAGAIKPGSAREALGDSWDDHFAVEVVKDVKTGKPKRSVQLADDRYARIDR